MKFLHPCHFVSCFTHVCSLELNSLEVNVFDKVIDTGVQRFIRIECPGVVEEEIEWQELANGVKARILDAILWAVL